MWQTHKAPSGARVAVALSGGIDSAAAALLLREAGYEVFGITMRLFDTPEPGDGPLKEAEAVARRMGITLEVVDLRDAFRECVISQFETGYLEGLTPNPCVICNREIKFGRMLEAAMSFGAVAMATGHYARLEREGGRFRLLRGAADRRDQAYFLHSLTQMQLSKLMFPLGSFENKQQVRALAEGFYGRNFFNQGESRSLCFLQGKSHVDYFIERDLMTACTGDFVTLSGQIICPHKGYVRYTIGQKRGLDLIEPEIPLAAAGQGRADWTVLKIDAGSGNITLGPDGSCFSHKLLAKAPKWIDQSLSKGTSVDVKICHWGYRLGARIGDVSPDAFDGEGSLEVLFDQPVRAVAPGQHVVFFDGEKVLGGACIVKV
jgi:tRNA-specific 2-thiouridylase